VGAYGHRAGIVYFIVFDRIFDFQEIQNSKEAVVVALNASNITGWVRRVFQGREAAVRCGKLATL
jgi:hypothetical protein